jgi:predicted N-acyltransferase
MAESDPVIARIAPGVAAVPADEWDSLAGGDDPFLSHSFLSLLEESGSVGPGTGWQSAPVCIDGPDGRLTAAAPAYLKAHSQGEYVFDQGWADAWRRAGGDYYPKLQVAVPFTPVPGRRLLARDATQIPALIGALEAVAAQNGLSSAHATFVAEEQLDAFRAAGWLIRRDSQFHWFDRGYGDFEGFLAALSSRKRKDLRKERATAQAAVRIEALTGEAIRPEHWDVMWACYQDTGARKWGTPYWTREAFTLLGQRMADKVLLLVAYDRDTGQPVAAALNLIGADALYGRYWGCLADIPCLHFELCYYQAIDFALAHGLGRVEAGAQGQHKLARGYEPVPTWSAHHIPHPGFRAAVADYLEREVAAVEQESQWLAGHAPFRRGGD